MEYLAHIVKDGRVQTIYEHLTGTAAIAAEFGAPFGAADEARFAGMLHDIGKYSDNGQKRQRDPEHTAKVDHATAGAQLAGREAREAVRRRVLGRERVAVDGGRERQGHARGSPDGPDADGAGVFVLPLVEGPHVEPSFIVNSVVRRLTLMIGSLV